ncbi:MAG: hypothetical protein C0436_05415 [Alphaproteobacteria bacterium]|nr:hypothetical protein [Alphaproteobacteria bacterium]
MAAFTAAALAAALMTMATPAKAEGYDIYGGAAGTQTIHHCGWIPTQRMIYTNVSRNTVIIQRKLTQMGYYNGAVDGLNTPITKAAVAAFQRDYGLKVDGIVGVETSTAIGYAGNSASWVRTCHRPYNPSASRI